MKGALGGRLGSLRNFKVGGKSLEGSYQKLSISTSLEITVSSFDRGENDSREIK